ncbi:transglutaminase family protein [Oscillatoria amoena NRMC-F 0135]|nr:transglutaminase family protein [Oscillatoria laete-virens]MDL5048018.1 transglutaminase family protein [Oscillatoria amoena NRMC-F 0135]MDL5052501.1 transglutaminase family protein [Oscillatoria laete-virens NRMC-F 0139]
MILNILHRTRYTYRKSVSFGAHRCLIRPIEGHDLKIRSSSLAIAPAHRVRWVHDIFNNCVALVEFLEPADELLIESRVEVDQYNANPFDFVLEPHALKLPMAYDAHEFQDISPYLVSSFPGDHGAVKAWIGPFLDLKGRAGTLDFFTALNKSVPMFFSYARREMPGVQSPAETLSIRSGSCRDFALLLMEAARAMGCAARFVSGYLCGNDDISQEAAAGATHAWAEIYLPGAGWKGFDPTCGRLADDYHVRVAVAREPFQAPPVSGSYIGSGDLFQGMDVHVDVRKIS